MHANDVQSSELFAGFCEEAKQGIAEVLRKELIPEGAPVAGEKVPIVKNRRILTDTPQDWATLLRSERHKEGTGLNEVEKVHAFMVGYAGIDTDSEDNTVSQKSFRLRFVIDSYYENKVGSDTDNPEILHGREIHKIGYALVASRVCNRPGVVKKVVAFRERRGFTRLGEALMRESLAELIIELQPVPLVKTV